MRRVKIDVRALAEALAARLNGQLPGGCWLTCGTVEGWGGVALFMNTAEGSWGGSGIAELRDTIDAEELPFVTERILDAIQDDVAEATRGTAWPADPKSGVPLPEPWAKVAGDVLSFGYGSRTLVERLPLSEITT
jgi:hypothetical protein